MIKVENVSVTGFEAAVRGMRNPLNSWAKSDSCWCFETGEDCGNCIYKKSDGDDYECLADHPGRVYVVGENDLDLMKRLYKAGGEHRKWARMVHVTMDVTAPLYWWKEADTYKIATTANSCSTMHKIHDKEFTIHDFSHEHLKEAYLDDLYSIIYVLNGARKCYLENKNKDYWWQMIQLLPTSYNQKRTWDINYETVFTIIKQRTGHKLDEWNQFVEVLKDLPYVRQIGEF